MTEHVQLNQQYGIRDQLIFSEGPGGITLAEIRNSRGEATVALHGGHVLSFRPRDQAPVLWLSEQCQYKTGYAIRGGIPVCWPWFGNHPSDKAKPAHGFVRTTIWSVSESETLGDGCTRLKLSIADSESTRLLWPHRFRLTIEITVSDALTVKLMATNTDHKPFICSGALHSYFNISSISNITIKGLAGCAYIDKVDQERRKMQEGAVSIQRETDRIYLDTQADCIIEDRGMHRRMVIAKNGSRTTVVWNPWVEKARRMKDFGDDEYKNMVCVETVNAGTDVITLAPGNTHTLEGIIRLESRA